ncbi:hypothetical protein CBM2585_A130229 [Cupriavidus taiwanensis]|nr:hypothetical protein CBM2585_A130229 [Cupriavidus taiwanensis]
MLEVRLSVMVEVHQDGAGLQSLNHLGAPNQH